MAALGRERHSGAGVSHAGAVRSGPDLLRLRQLAPSALRLFPLGVCPLPVARDDPWRAGQEGAVHPACRAVRHLDGGVPAALRPLDRVLRLESVVTHRPPVQRPGQYPPDDRRSVLLERPLEHGALHRHDPGGICDRLRACPPPERRHPGEKILARGLSPAADAVPGRGLLDGRQVHAGGHASGRSPASESGSAGNSRPSSARPRSPGSPSWRWTPGPSSRS